MRKLYVVITIIFIINCSLQAEEHYIGVKSDITIGGLKSNYFPYSLSIIGGFSYSLFLKNNFSLQNNISIGYDHIGFKKEYIRDGFNISSSFYPMFMIQKDKIGIGISALGVKIIYSPYSYVSYNKEIELRHWENYWDKYMSPYYGHKYNYYLNIGLSEKISYDIFLGKENDIILSVFYCELDFLFTVLYDNKIAFGIIYPYDFPFFRFNIGIGSSISFKIKNKKNKDEK